MQDVLITTAGGRETGWRITYMMDYRLSLTAIIHRTEQMVDLDTTGFLSRYAGWEVVWTQHRSTGSQS